MNRILIALCVVLLWVASGLAHENDSFKHQTESLMRYGVSSIWPGLTQIFIDPDQDMCVDSLFIHDIVHLTKPYKCDDPKHGRK